VPIDLDQAQDVFAASRDGTVGLEEEFAILDPATLDMVPRFEELRDSAPPELAQHITGELIRSEIEIVSGRGEDLADALARQRGARRRLFAHAAASGVALGASGTHPWADYREQQFIDTEHYRRVASSLQYVAKRNNTFSLHVHVGVADPEDAVRVANAMRVHLPVLLALSANSPFWQGRDTGLASARTPLFQAFPRVGIPRAFADYEDWAHTVDLLVRCDAFPEPTFLWWDVRLQPKLGTVEIRVMDAQTRLEANAALVALVQCLVRLETLEGFAEPLAIGSPEVLDENRFLAARDGADAALIDPVAERRVPLAEIVEGMLDACRPHAQDLGCPRELEAVGDLLRHPPTKHQLMLARRRPDRLHGLVSALADEY